MYINYILKDVFSEYKINAKYGNSKYNTNRLMNAIIRSLKENLSVIFTALCQNADVYS